MPSDDKLSWLEQLSNVLAGQSATAGAKALGTGIGYGLGGGALSDIPDVMREAVERHKAASNAPKPKSERDALELASALAAMSNPVSLAGHTVDFLSAAPSMIEQKLSGEPLPTGEVMQSGLKRRLQKGGAAADYAVANQLERAKANIRSRGLMQSEPEAFLPISSKNAKWGPGEGKFQSIEDYASNAYDLANKVKGQDMIGMGQGGMSRIISGQPNPLGVEFDYTMGLDPKYRDKGYGKEIYQNMADVYGGGISDAGSTSGPARKVYQSLEAIDTGIPSGGGTRMAIPTREMKANPEAMAAFQQKVKEYADKKTQKIERRNQPQRSTGPIKFFDDVDGPAINDALLEFGNFEGKPVPDHIVAELINSITGKELTADEMPNTIDLAGYRWRRAPHSRVFEFVENEGPATSKPTRPSFTYTLQDALDAQSDTDANRLNNYLRSQTQNGSMTHDDLISILQRFGIGGYQVPRELNVGGTKYQQFQDASGRIRYRRFE